MTAPKRKPVIGLLGGVGAGKSTVAAELARLGCAVLDADRIGRRLLAEPDVKAELVRLWGEGIVGADGEVDRPAVAEKVFGDPAELAALNAVMHPRIRRRLSGRIEALAGEAAVKAIVLDAALLLETDWHELCTDFVFVAADAELRRRRAAQRRGWDERSWLRREKSQKSLDIKAARADHVIDNSSSLSRLREQVHAILHRVLQAAERPPRQRPE